MSAHPSAAERRALSPASSPRPGAAPPPSLLASPSASLPDSAGTPTGHPEQHGSCSGLAFPRRCSIVIRVMCLRPLSTLWLAASLYGQALTTVVAVPATSNPYLAGMPNGTRSTYGDRAPRPRSPVLVNLSLTGAVAVTFAASGRVNHVSQCPPACDPPNGAELTAHQNGAEHGISDIVAPINSLLGLFLTDERPDRSRAPKGLTFRTDFVSLSPQLKQIFFIGSGATRTGVVRRYLVPAGATGSTWR